MEPDNQSIHVEIIAWFTAETVDEVQGEKVFRAGRCRVCNKEITRHVLLDAETATPEEVSEAREASHRDGETFFAHLYTAHRELFGDDDPTDFVSN